MILLSRQAILISTITRSNLRNIKHKTTWRRLMFLFILGILSTNGFSQNVIDAKPQKNYDWGVSDEFHSEPGFAGSYWHTAMRIICDDNDTFLLSIYKPASNGYYAIHEDENCYVKLENDSIITLHLNTDYSPWNYERSGYYSNNIWMPKRFFTQTFYNITNIHDIIDKNIIKLRWIIDGKPYDIDYAQNNWVKKFNKRIRNAVTQAQQRFKEKAKFKDNNLDGF